MEQITSNMQKYANYKEQMERLNKAIEEHFYLEAIFIEYFIMEDRVKSSLRYSKVSETNIQKHRGLGGKIGKLKDVSREKRSLAHKYFDENFLEEIITWCREDRDPMMHSLMDQNLRTEDFERVASKGYELTKTFKNIATEYNRAVKKQNETEAV